MRLGDSWNRTTFCVEKSRYIIMRQYSIFVAKNFSKCVTLKSVENNEKFYPVHLKMSFEG